VVCAGRRQAGSGRGLLGKVETLAQGVEASGHHPSVPVIGQRTDPATSTAEVVAGGVDVAELAIGLREVEVQGGVEGRDRRYDAGSTGAFIREGVCCSKGFEI